MLHGRACASCQHAPVGHHTCPCGDGVGGGGEEGDQASSGLPATTDPPPPPSPLPVGDQRLKTIHVFYIFLYILSFDITLYTFILSAEGYFM